MESRKTFRDWKPNEYVHRPVTPTEVLPEDDLENSGEFRGHEPIIDV